MRRARRTLLPLMAAGAALLLGAWRPREHVPAAPAGFVVIANASNPAASIAKADLARIFLRKSRAWPGARLPASPVDQKEASPARKAFIGDVIGKDAAGMTAYWQSQIFVGGSTPPPVKASDADVIAFVAGTPGAIGYVSPEVELPATVKALKVDE